MKDGADPLVVRGIFNFRDVGGLPVSDGGRIRPGRLLRGDALHRVDEAGVAHLHAVGAGLVVDLRTHEEVERAGRFPEHELVAWRHHALMDEVWGWSEEAGEEGPSFLLARYVETLEIHGDRFAPLVEWVVTAERGVVLHCAAGKDRTGMTTAFLLALAGVPDEDIVADYARSGAAVPAQIAWLREHLPHVLEGLGDAAAGGTMAGTGGSVTDDALAGGLWSAHPDVMEGFLAELDRRGGASAVARDHGVDDDLLAELRAVLVDRE